MRRRSESGVLIGANKIITNGRSILLKMINTVVLIGSRVV